MTLRARIVLLAAQGLQNKHIAQALGVGRVRSRAGASATCSTRKMGAVLDAVLDVSASTVMRHWQANGLKPHIVRGFKVSRDPKFVEKLEDIVGLDLSPPEPALGLCCDEKSQVKALEQCPRLSKQHSPTFK